MWITRSLSLTSSNVVGHVYYIVLFVGSGCAESFILCSTNCELLALFVVELLLSRRKRCKRFDPSSLYRSFLMLAASAASFNLCVVISSSF